MTENTKTQLLIGRLRLARLDAQPYLLSDAADALASREALLAECREVLNIYRFRKGFANSDWQFERDVDALLSKLDKGAV